MLEMAKPQSAMFGVPNLQFSQHPLSTTKAAIFLNENSAS
jgi:hypothetical protein